MKNFLSFLFFSLLATSLYSQSTVNPDTVCYQSNSATYTQPLLAGYTFTWVVSAPGVITSGQGTNQINVNWSTAAPGLIPNAVSVSAINAAGCQTPPVDLDVFILQIVPVITPVGPFCDGEPCVNLTASVTGGIFSGPGVVGGQFCPNIAGQGVHNVSYNVTVGGCPFSATLAVNVTNTPVLAPISHD
jgi:hypothetical protein